MKNLCLLFILCILASSVWAAETLVPAVESCRTDIGNPDTNRTDSSKLSIRSDGSAAKSWIKFDISGIEPNDIRAAELRLTLHENENAPAEFDVSAVNDDYLTNIGWTESDLTWNNAPANDTASFSDVLSSAASLMGTIVFTTGLAGEQSTIDVTSALQADTDSIVQFALHNSNQLINASTHDHGGGEDYWPTLIITLPPEGADFPNPVIDEVVPDTLPSLSWTNPDPNDGISDITCTVYLGIDPNRPQMDGITLAAGASSVAINTTNFPTYGSLINNTTYYWFVDSEDPSRVPTSIPGEEWSFIVAQSPSVSVTAVPSVVWLSGDPNVLLDGTVIDDGTPVLTWTQEDTGAPDVTINPDNQEDTTITFTERGDYEFTLTADDGITPPVSETVRVVVGDDPCDASHINSGEAYNVADINEDCIVDLIDLADLILADWLNCTDTITNCGN